MLHPWSYVKTPAQYAVLSAAALMLFLGCALAGPAKPPSRADFLSMAERGWVFQIRSSVLRRHRLSPPVQFNSKDTANGTVCVFGEDPHPLSVAVIESFDALLADVFGRTRQVSFGGQAIGDCPPHQRVYLRLYSGHAPGGKFNADLRDLDRAFGIGLPQGRAQLIASPAQAIGFFGRQGNTAHILVRQPGRDAPSELERAFYVSILVEELYQIFSYGSDILKLDSETPFYSKLQERPVYLKHLPWESEEYMAGLLGSNPKGLCGFDVFMLHALAQTSLDSTNSNAFLDFIDAEFETLIARTDATLADPRFARLLDVSCGEIPH